MLVLTVLLLLLAAFSFCCTAASLKLAATIVQRTILPWKTAAWVALLCFSLGLASLLVGAAQRVLPLNPVVADIGSILTLLATWLLPIWMLKKALVIRAPRALGVWIVTLVLMLPLSIGTALAFRTFAFQAFKIPSAAMAPTLLVGDHLLASKYVYRFSEPARDDVIVFLYPADRSKNYIKRVTAIAGDTVEVRNKIVYLNGEKIDDPHAFHDPSIPGSKNDFGPFEVPEGQVFVMGDNRENSYDSRFWGTVPVNDIVGRAFMLYWSWNSESAEPRFERIGMRIP